MIRLLLATVLAIACAPSVVAQGEGMPPSRSVEMKEEAASMVDRIGATVDPNLTFTDERGYPFQLRQLFPGSQPVVLLLGYYSCPAMCGQVLDAMLKALSDVDLQPGTDYRILNVSIDPRETATTAKERKQRYLPKLIKTGGDDAWRVCVGDEANIKALTESVGFRYYWAEHLHQYAHPPAAVFLTPDGRVGRVIVNTWFEPDDVRLAIVESSGGKLGTLWDQVRLNCLTFDPRTNTYSLTAMTIMRIGGALTVVVMIGMLVHMLRKERRRAAPAVA